MDMRKYMDFAASDIESNKAAMSFELAGKKLEFTMDGGENVSLSFASFPARDVFAGGSAEGIPYDCVKIGAQVFYLSYLLPEARAGYVLDLDTGLITRVLTDVAGDTAITFGAAGGTEKRHAFTGEMSGNTIQWTLGKQPSSVFKAVYGAEGAAVARPGTAEAPAIDVSDFQAVRINENIILQSAAVRAGGVSCHVNMVSNFWNVTSVGDIYAGHAPGGGGARIRRFAGYGRYEGEAGAKGAELYKLSPFRGEGISQFTPPYCFELAGESFEFVMDDGYDYFLRFIDGGTLEWNWAGGAPKREKYLCLKGDDTTYLLSFELEGASPRANHTFVIDRENDLVTRLISRIGTNPKYPYLMKTEYEFGAIRREGAEIKLYPRHGFSDDLAGNILQWTYDSHTASVHSYYCTNYYRISYPRDPAYSEAAKRMSDMFNEILTRLPSSDEPCTYIKIKEGMYLFTLTEVNGEKILGADMGGFRSNTMSYLDNFKTLRGYGRSFGTSTPPDGEEVHRHMMYATFGKVVDPDGDDSLKKLLSDPNPFIIGG